MNDSDSVDKRTSVLITGGAGYIGRLVTRELAQNRGEFKTVVSTDVRAIPPDDRLDGVSYDVADVRSPKIGVLVDTHKIDTVVHLAAIVTPGRHHTRQFQYEVDVEGTRNVLDACVANGVRKLIYTSSGAAYGYSPHNRALLSESDPLNADEQFAYAWHKRLVEEMLAEYRDRHPGLEQLIFRVSTILGPTVRNQITGHLEHAVIIGLEGAATPFCFVADVDVVGAIVAGVHGARAGIFNLTGDGALTLREIAHIQGRRYVSVSVGAMKGAFSLLKRLKVRQFEPEQVVFLLYRPVLDNYRLKTDFGYRPRMNSREAFEYYRKSRI